jgi:hypothetical protein
MLREAARLRRHKKSAARASGASVHYLSAFRAQMSDALDVTIVPPT